MKLFGTLALVFFCAYNGYICTYANVNTEYLNDASINREDVYIYKYYENSEGQKFRRLWNATKGEWAEPYWSPCP